LKVVAGKNLPQTGRTDTDKKIFLDRIDMIHKIFKKKTTV
jgi:hypothetical protein